MITLAYPAYAPTRTLSLRGPMRGDNEAIQSTLNVFLTRDNTLRSYTQSRHGKVFNATFEGILCDERDAVVEFFRNLQGNYIRYKDYIDRPIGENQLIRNSVFNWSNQYWTNWVWNYDWDTNVRNLRNAGTASSTSANLNRRIVPGQTYTLTLTVVELSTNLYIRLGGNTNQYTISALGTQTFSLTAESLNNFLTLVPVSSGNHTIDTVTLTADQYVPTYEERKEWILSLLDDNISIVNSGADKYSFSISALRWGPVDALLT